MWESKILDVRMANLFQRDVSVISRHVNNVFKENELDKESNLHFLQFANSDKPVAFYSLILLLNSHARTLGTTINETVQTVGY